MNPPKEKNILPTYRYDSCAHDLEEGEEGKYSNLQATFVLFTFSVGCCQILPKTKIIQVTAEPTLSCLLLGLNVGAGNLAIANIVNSCLASTREAILRWDALDTVRGVDVLHEGQLPARGTALA